MCVWLTRSSLVARRTSRNAADDPHARGTNDYLVQATLSVATAYGSYLLGEQLHLSGVLAVVSAGSVFGNFGRRFGRPRAPARSESAGDELILDLTAVVGASVTRLAGGVAHAPGARSRWEASAYVEWSSRASSTCTGTTGQRRVSAVG
jgi:hypothetical protein